MACFCRCPTPPSPRCTNCRSLNTVWKCPPASSSTTSKWKVLVPRSMVANLRVLMLLHGGFLFRTFFRDKPLEKFDAQGIDHIGVGLGAIFKKHKSRTAVVGVHVGFHIDATIADEGNPGRFFTRSGQGSCLFADILQDRAHALGLIKTHAEICRVCD